MATVEAVTGGSFAAWAWLIPVVPAVSSGSLLLGGHRTRHAAAATAIAAAAAAAGMSAAVFASLLAQPASSRTYIRTLAPWLEVGDLRVEWALLVDPLSAVMLVLVTWVGLLVHVYSVGYMRDDPLVHRYFAYLNLFVASMLLLVLAESLAVLFVGWELVGATSYLLIGFWFERREFAGAATKAFMVNRIGDVAFLVAMFVTFAAVGSLSLADVWVAAPTLPASTAAAIGLLLFVGAAAKSAQVPFFVWLPDAMAGPTPVSALLHAATMVTAGVYLVVRVYPLYAAVPTVGAGVAWVGIVSALLGALAACAQSDIKHVLAYSTVSQLGYMMVAAGIGAPVAAVFHLLVQGAVKALLFLVAGSVMHALNGESHLWRMGGLWRRLPATAGAALVGVLALAGVPPLSAFWSKEQILAAALDTPGARGIWVLGLVTGAVTAFYVGRWFILVFLGSPRWSAPTQPREAPASMVFPVVLLAVASATAGMLNLSAEEGLLAGWLAPAVAAFAGDQPLVAHAAALWVTVALAVTGLVLAWDRYGRGAPVRGDPAGLTAWAASGFGVDEGYRRVLALPGRRLAESLATFDRIVVDGAVRGTAALVRRAGSAGSRLQTGQVRGYALAVLAGTLVVFAVMAATAARP